MSRCWSKLLFYETFRFILLLFCNSLTEMTIFTTPSGTCEEPDTPAAPFPFLGVDQSRIFVSSNKTISKHDFKS